MMEEQTIGTKLTQLQATDIDSNIEAYHLSTNDYLEINNITGKLSSSNTNKCGGIENSRWHFMYRERERE